MIKQEKDKYCYVLTIPFEKRMEAKSLNAFYDPKHKLFLTEEINENNKPYLAEIYSYEKHMEKVLNKVKKISTETKASKKIIPRDYQVEAFKKIDAVFKNGYKNFLLADEVGLGKTISACSFLELKEFNSILIVTTLSAIPHWQQTCLKYAYSDKKNIIIINYDRLQKLFDSEKQIKKKEKTVKKTLSKKTKNKVITKSGDAWGFDCIVWDESHKMKNSTSLRFKLGQKLIQKSKFNLFLSATAGQNPLELIYLSSLLAEATGQSVRNLKDFELWCQKMNFGVKRGAFGKWEWDRNNETTKRVYDILFKSVQSTSQSLRRVPSDIKGYPEISRLLHPVGLTNEQEKQYNLYWEDFKNSIKNKNKNNNNLNNGKLKNKNLNHLVEILRFRQKASFLKCQNTIDFAFDLLDNNLQVAISVGFIDSLDLIKQALNKKGVGVSVIHGDLTPFEKEKQRLLFQKGENKVVIFTVEEAISLHQGEHNDIPRTTIVHDLRWSGISMAQIEGRTHRDGKFSQIYWAYSKNTIEEKIANIVLNRVISMKSMVGDDTAVLDDILKLI